MGPWCCDCEVMGFDGEDMSFMMAPSNVNIYEHRFINAIVLLRAQNEVPHKGHNGNYMEVEGPCHDLQDHCSQ